MAKQKIDIESLPSNNITTPNKQIEPVARTIPKKQTDISNTVRDMGNQVFGEIILPGIKSTLVDSIESLVGVVMNGIRASIFGGTVPPSGGGHIAYHNKYKGGGRKVYRAKRGKQSYSEPLFEDLFFRHRQEAERVLARMQEIILDYGWASIGDYYSLVGKTSSSWTHENFGWDDLRNVRIQFVGGDGYIIAFPEPDSL